MHPAVARVLGARNRRVCVVDIEHEHRPRAFGPDAADDDGRWRVIDLQRCAVALAREGSGRRVGRRVGCDHPDEVRAVGHDRRIPDQDGLVEATAERRPLRLPFAPVQHVVDELVVVLVVGSPGERLEALLVGAPAERR